MTISVSDGKFIASLPPFRIDVAVANRAPVIGGNGDANVLVGTPYAFTPSASDPDGDPLTFSISGRPAWLAFSTTNGALSGTPSAADVGSHAMSIMATDGRLSASLPVTVGVVDVATGDATLSWVGPTTRTDGSPLADLAGYRIYYGTVQGSENIRIDAPSPGLTTYVVTGLAPATWWFTMTAVDSAGVESARTASVSKTVN